MVGPKTTRSWRGSEANDGVLDGDGEEEVRRTKAVLTLRLPTAWWCGNGEISDETEVRRSSVGEG